MVSEATVKTHVARILSRLGLRDRVQVVVLAYESGFVRPGEAEGGRGRMRRITEDALTITDARGRRYPPRPLALKVAETVARSIAVAGVLACIGVIWEAFH